VNLKRPSLKGASLKSKLKGPELKAPDFLADFYFDLRDRRLLPLIGLVVVAIAAAPFLLGSDEEPQVPSPAPEVAGVDGPAVDGARLTVVESTPGLRDYRKRLHGKPADPFVQRYTGVPSTSQLESTGTGGEDEVEAPSGGEPAVSSEPSSGGEATDGGSSPGSSGGAPPASGGGEGGAGPKKPRLFEFVVDVQISHTEATEDGRQKMGKPAVHRAVRPLTQLPGKKAPVVTTMGINLHSGKVMFLVSDEVRSLDGEFDCAGRTPDGICELLEVEAGFPLELIYGPNEVRYRIKPTRIDVVRAGSVGDERSSRAEAALEARYGASFQNFTK
jgi:hypothetical protein